IATPLSFFYSPRANRALHSFPTRRSSDLLSPTDREGRESADLEAFAFLAIPLERLLRAAVFKRFAKRLDVETGLSRDVRLDFDRSEEHTSELQSRFDLVCRLLLEKKKKKI